MSASSSPHSPNHYIGNNERSNVGKAEHTQQTANKQQQNDYSNATIEEERSLFNIYPNPAQNTLTILAKETKTIAFSLFNLLGQKVLQQEIKGTTTIDVSELKQGIYFYKLGEEGQGKITIIK